MNSIMIAGAASGVGKTTISLGIMAAFSNRGNRVVPFKVGPDYIDPGFHKFVTNNPSYNLDSWMIKEETLEYLFRRNLREGDIGIVEGVMGLYDGFGIDKDNGSSAHVSKILDIPVVLVINARGMSSSAAAMILGYKLYDTEVDIKGVILNQVSGEAHYELLKGVIERDVGVECLGYLPSNLDISLNSRHLGLIPAEEVDNLRKKTNELADLVERYVDLDKLEKISKYDNNIKDIKNPISRFNDRFKGLRIGVARDKAFSFYYEDNFKLMKELGIEIVEFSPLNDKDIPSNIDGLYMGGGFPEVFGNQLQENKMFRENLRRHLEEGLPAYAECGALMYLTEGITDLDGEYFEMVGFFHTSSKMTKRLQKFGYVEVDFDRTVKTKAHEFHRSLVKEDENSKYKYVVKKIRNGKVTSKWKCGLVKENTLAAYAHIHFYSNPEFIIDLLERCIDKQDYL